MLLVLRFEIISIQGETSFRGGCANFRDGHPLSITLDLRETPKDLARDIDIDR